MKTTDRRAWGSLLVGFGLLALAGCDNQAVTACNQLQAATCDAQARCAPAGTQDLARQTCLAVAKQTLDCATAMTVPSQQADCLSALGNLACGAPSPIACQGITPLPPPPPPPTCVINPQASLDDQLNALGTCMGNAVSLTTVDTRQKPELDVLFVVDNSTSMSSKQKALAQAIPSLIKKIESLNVNYHVGVVTTDVGTLPPPGTPFPGSTDTRCNTLSGEDGALQKLACTQRSGSKYSAEFGAACTALCPDGSFVPSSGSWIQRENGVTNVPVLMSQGSDVGPIRAFQCMALVGDAGCGIESPLDAAKRALDGHRTENTGFLRPSSTLAVIFLTDEDDASVQLAQRGNLNPTSMSCPTGGTNPDYRCFSLDYRPTAKSLQCNQSLDTPGLKTGCKERADSFLEPIDTYVTFFNALRPANRLVVSGIWSPSLLDYNAGLSTQGKLEVDTEVPGDYATLYLNRGYRAKAACYNPDPLLTTDIKGFIGSAQIRLSSFARRMPLSSERSICDAANYGQALDQVGTQLDTALASCLLKKPKVVDGKPQCVAGLVDVTAPTAAPTLALPVCGTSCCEAWASSAKPTFQDAAIKASCQAESSTCYCALPSTRADVCTGGAVVGGAFAGGTAPAGKILSYRCINE